MDLTSSEEPCGSSFICWIYGVKSGGHSTVYMSGNIIDAFERLTSISLMEMENEMAAP